MNLGTNTVDELRFQRPDNSISIIALSLSLHRFITSSVARCPFNSPLLFRSVVVCVSFVREDVSFFIAFLCLVTAVKSGTASPCLGLQQTRQQRAWTANDKVRKPWADK